MIPFYDGMPLDDFNDAITMRQFAEAESEGVYKGMEAARWVQSMIEERWDQENRSVLEMPII